MNYGESRYPQNGENLEEWRAFPGVANLPKVLQECIEDSSRGESWTLPIGLQFFICSFQFFCDLLCYSHMYMGIFCKHSLFHAYWQWSFCKTPDRVKISENCISAFTCGQRSAFFMSLYDKRLCAVAFNQPSFLHGYCYITTWWFGTLFTAFEIFFKTHSEKSLFKKKTTHIHMDIAKEVTKNP